jgi:hypothetical protein
MPEPIPERVHGRFPFARLVYRAELRFRESAETTNEPADRPVEARRRKWDEQGLRKEDELAERVEEAALSFFGPGVRAETRVAPGESLEISILLMALGAVAAYRTHIENLAWFADHVRGIIKRVFPPLVPSERVLVTEEDILVTTESATRSDAVAEYGGATPVPAVRWFRSLLLALLAAEIILVGLVAALLVIALTD